MAKSMRKKAGKKSAPSTKIDETDEMKLKLLADLNNMELQDIAIYPPELNTQLIEQLQTLTAENGSLRKCLFTKDSEIKELETTIDELKERIRDIISSTGPAISLKSAGIISDKISALCKQNRHLVAEVESYKTKVSKLERKLNEIEMKTKEPEKPEHCQCKTEPIDNDPDEVKELNNKLNAVNKKLYESKNKNLELKNDILVATKILQQEIGDKFINIKDLQNDLAGWKGRAQQIVLLQAKIQELEEKLNGNQKDNIEVKGKDHIQKIREYELKRKNEVDLAMRELDRVKQENFELKRKLDGSRCRIRNLECDIGMFRQKIQTFTEKSQHDDLLVSEQRNQIKNLELHYEELLKENTNKMYKLKSEVKEFQIMISNNDSKVKALSEQLSEKTRKIQDIQEQLEKYKKCSLQAVFFTPMKLATENEIAKLSELVVSLNKRLDIERHHWEDLDKRYREVKEKKIRAEKKIVNLENELGVLKNSKKSLKITRSISSKDTNGEGSEGHMLKKVSVASYSLEKHENCNCNLLIDELKCKLELSQEKIKIMEDKLKMTVEEKSEDYQALINMIQTSKQYFNEALVALKEDKCPCPL
ncbi:coiled-coil domain-containing protein 13 isoform X2 [Aricia agestis]|uniref:coiled-coil domain-containing protein 13 isoform X2 n=1 Tax=Aricia agestis TaxID=91739 RepID=UPI001C202E23|nr:coiled-coil domain-containing protein 13 isoform X2 [Aricia agestis]